MKKILAIAVLCLVCMSAFAVSVQDIYFNAGVIGAGSLSDTAHSVCAQIDLGGRIDGGFFLNDDFGVYASLGFMGRIVAKQFDRFADVPSYMQISLGAGGFARIEELFFSVDADLVMALVNESWECGAQLTLFPHYVFDRTSIDFLRYSIGFPISVVYTGNTNRFSFGVALSVEVFK